jgi:outer membrane protein W/outer membrane protein OmpA-like peptidoglycan-associated protein
MYSKALKAMVVATLAAAPFAAQAWDTAPGEQKGDFLVRAGLSYLNPESDNLKPIGPLAGLPESTLVVDEDVSPTFDVTWMFHNNFGVELLLAWPFTHGIDVKPYAGGGQSGGGRIRAGYTDHLPPTLSLVWRPMDAKASVQPYVGVGANYTMFSSEKLRGDTLAAIGLPTNTKLGLDDSFGAAGVVGVDIFPGEAKKWFGNVQVRYLQIESDADIRIPATTTPGGNPVSARIDVGSVDINPWIVGLHVGRRFGAPAPEPVAAPPPPPPPPPPMAPAKCADGDGDGVCDEADKCPNTPAGTKVDKVGCPLEQTLKVLFDFDSAELRAESITELERVVTFMNDVPFATSLIEGHTDSVGSAAYNLKLSDRRAKAVYDYLTSRGVDPARLSSIGHGLTKPIADNATAEGRQLNRRVMLIRTDSGM